jgi:hypothetical protein
MPYFVAAEEVEPVVRGLLGVIDVDGGPTDEQLEVLWSITDHLWKRADTCLNLFCYQSKLERYCYPTTLLLLK